jgi:SPP1 gp7 family putative phage head morphogenesis protein
MNKLDEELIELVEELFDTSEEEHREVLELYKESQDNIINFFSLLFAKFGKDGILHFADLQKYNRMESIQKFLKEEVEGLVNKEIVITTAILLALYSSTYNRHLQTMERYLQTKLKHRNLSTEFIKDVIKLNWNGIHFEDRIFNGHSSLVNTILTDFTNAVRRQESLDKIIDNIEKQFATRYNHSNSLIVTESSHVISTAQEDLYRDTKRISKLLFAAIIDGVTSKFCREHNGLIYKIDDPSRPILPAHINCRSVWLPVFE